VPFGAADQARRHHAVEQAVHQPAALHQAGGRVAL